MKDKNRNNDYKTVTEFKVRVPLTSNCEFDFLPSLKMLGIKPAAFIVDLTLFVPQADFKLMCDNAMVYNRPETVYYKAAKKLLHTGFKMMSKVTRSSKPKAKTLYSFVITTVYDCC